MDYRGTLDGEPFAGGEGRDQMVELGSGRLVPGFEEQLEGAAAGEERTVTVTFPDDYPADRARRPARPQFAVTVKEVKAKELPELDDDLAAEAGFDTLDELREDIRTRLAEAEAAQIEAEFREAALDSAVKDATRRRSPTRSSRRAPASCGTRCCTRSRTRASRARRTCGSPAATRTRSSSESKPDAEQALRREAVLAAIVEAEGIEPTDEEVLEAVEQAAGDGAAHVAEEAARAAEVHGPARRRSRRTSRSARRSTSSPSRRSRSRSSRRRPATSSGHPATRGAKSGSTGQLWTPGS